jgi:hypothetical protein
VDWGFETVTDLVHEAEALRRRQYGMIEAIDGRFVRVVLRPFPKVFVVSAALPWTSPGERPLQGDCCRLYYNQPRSLPNFLALKYVVSGRAGTVATFRRVLEALDEIARIKGTDAIVCDAMNWKLSDRLMVRGGWESHCPSRWHRNFIKRFYGSYPSRAGWVDGVMLAGV